MIGRFIGVWVGLGFIAFAVLLWRPDLAPAGVSLNLGPWELYRLPITVLAAAFGAAVTLTALQRTSRRRRRALSPLIMPGPILEREPARSAIPSIAAAPLVVTPVALATEPELAPFPFAEIAAPTAPEIARQIAEAPPAEAMAPKPVDDPTPFSSIIEPGPFDTRTRAGDHARLDGRLDDAMDHYVEALVLARDAHTAAPDDPRATDNLAAALTNIGDIHDEQGQLEAALRAHEESLSLRRSLAAAEPNNKAAQRALSLGLERLADTREARGHRSRALDLYRESRPIAERLAAQHPDDPLLAKDLVATREKIAELEGKLT